MYILRCSVIVSSINCFDENELYASFRKGVQEYLADRKKSARFFSFLSQDQFTIKDTDITYRVINHWSKLGLLKDSRNEQESGWRKFSFIDVAWIKILSELRTFGLSLNKVKVAFQSISKDDFVLLEYGVSLAMLGKDICVVTFSDGQTDVIPREAIDKLNNKSYIAISLNACLNSVLNDDSCTPLPEKFKLSRIERGVISQIRAGVFDEVTVKFKDGKVDRVDTKTRHMGEIGKLSNVLNGVCHGDFVIKKQDGKVVILEAVKKIKVKA
jgi:Predicted transcriptional regulators